MGDPRILRPFAVYAAQGNDASKPTTDNRQPFVYDAPEIRLQEPLKMPGPITQFIQHHYRHFNAAALRAAADDYIRHLERGGKMLVTLAGAMSTAELGISLAEMIRQDKVHMITCTGANLEEDIYNLVAHDH